MFRPIAERYHPPGPACLQTRTPDASHVERTPKGQKPKRSRTPRAGLVTGFGRDGPPFGGSVPVARIHASRMGSNLEIGTSFDRSGLLPGASLEPDKHLLMHPALRVSSFDGW